MCCYLKAIRIADWVEWKGLRWILSQLMICLFLLQRVFLRGMRTQHYETFICPLKDNNNIFYRKLLVHVGFTLSRHPGLPSIS